MKLSECTKLSKLAFKSRTMSLGTILYLKPLLAKATKALTDHTESHGKLFLTTYNPIQSTKTDKRKLNELIKFGIGIKKRETPIDNQATIDINASMVEWLKKYVNSSDFFEEYDQKSLELMAEATFWVVNSKLGETFKKFDYHGLTEFDPLDVYRDESNPISFMLEEVADKLTKTNACWGATSQALKYAALAIYVKENSYKIYNDMRAGYKRKGLKSI